MSQPVHSSHDQGAASSRLERAGLDPAAAAAVIDEVQRGQSRFATADHMAKVEVALAGLQGDVRAVEARLGGRIDAVEARFDAVEARFDAVDTRFDAVDARFEAVDVRLDSVERRMDAQFDGARRENRLLLLVFSTVLGLLMALFRFGAF